MRVYIQDICDNPLLFVNGVNSSDLIQGELGNCWLVAACCCLSVHKFLWTKVSSSNTVSRCCTAVLQRSFNTRRYSLCSSTLPRVGSGQRVCCRISPPRFLAERRKRRLNQASFVLLCFALFAFSGLYLVSVLSVFLIFLYLRMWMVLYSLTVLCAVKKLPTHSLTHGRSLPDVSELHVHYDRRLQYEAWPNYIDYISIWRLLRDRPLEAVLSVYPSVCPSVRLSVTWLPFTRNRTRTVS